MALNNLFDMVKADRYTADGREAIIKAQEEETEDKVYQIGEISQKTGLQKTANGWVKPKNGKQPGAKKEEYKPSRRVDPKKHPQVSNPDVLGMTSNGAKKRFEALGGKFVENKDGVDIFKTRDGDLVKVHYGDNKKVARTETTHISNPDAADQRDQIGGEIKGNLETAKYYFDKAQSFSPTDPSYKTYMTKAKQYNDEAKAQADDNGFDFEEMHNSGITQAVNKYAEEQSKPAAEKPERFDYRSSLEKNPRDAFSFKGTVTHSIPTNQYHYDELQNLASFMREEKATYQNALKSRAQALVDGHRSNGDWEPKKEQALMDIAKAVGFDKELHKFIEEENRGYDLGYSEDSAPRVLTGDTRIRVRKA